MPAEKNRVLRVVVPIVIALGAIAVVVAGYRNSARQSQPSNATATAQTPLESAGSDRAALDAPAEAAEEAGEREPAGEAAAGGSDVGKAEAPSAPSVSAAPEAVERAAVEPSMATYRSRLQPVPASAPASIGGLSPGGAEKAQISFTLQGAGVSAITMADHFETIAKKQHYEVQRQFVISYPNGSKEVLSSLAARAIIIDGVLVDLFGSESAPVWREAGPGRFEAEVVDEADRAVLRIERRYALRPGSFIFDVDQRVTNLSDRAFQIDWVQYGPVELHEDIGGYGLDMRRVRLGYLLDQRRDPSRQIVSADGKLAGRATYVDRVLKRQDGLVWPRGADFKGSGELVWLAQTSRYFAFAVMPRLDPGVVALNAADPQANPIGKSLRLADEVFAVVRGTGDAKDLRLLLQLTSGRVTLAGAGAAGSEADFSFSAYAGPLGRRELSARADPLFESLSLKGLLIYNLGGMCAFCTFQPLARGLLAFLTFAHDYLVFDWAIAIMLLVVCVRGVLHPLTRRSQISLARFSKQMQAVAPKQQKIREKFKDDPKRMQEEMIRLMREEKVNYTGALGCLPMFLQTPIWIALYAMLYFSFDLRHAPAFFGVFQTISGGAWSFMGDLSVADHFIDFGAPLFTIPLFGPISGLNVLPVVLGVVFYIQQKYLTPPPTGQLSPEAEMQHKMIKVMMVFMFPLLMYNAPAGLSLYFITNSTLGILESRWIRAHINELDKNPPPPRGGGLLGLRKVENRAAKRKG